MPLGLRFFLPFSIDAPPQTIGIALAIGGNLIISFSLALTKYAHNLNQMRKTPLPYTHLPLWWCGLAATVVGECGNFAAYGFAGASLIAPLGAVSVLANAFISALVLGEGLRLRDLTGCALCITGGSVVVLSTPETSHELDPPGFMVALQATPFVVYIVILLATVLAMLGMQDAYGHRHVAYFVLLCSLLGSVTVLACKGVATFLSLWLCCGAPSPFADPVMYLLVLVLTSTAVLQIRYLNMAMERFGNTETVPVYYVLFTLSTIVGSNVLYRDFENEDRATVALFAGGCVMTFGGVWLLTSRRQRARAISASDSRREPMLGGAPSAAERAIGDPASVEPLAHSSSSDQPLVERFLAPPARVIALADDEGLGYEPGVPLGLSLNSPGFALTGDVLRRTFSERLETFSERARACASGTAQSDDALEGGGARPASGGHHRTNSSPGRMQLP